VTTNETSTRGHLGAAKLHLLGRAELVHGHSGDAGGLRFLPERRFRLLAYLALRGEWVSRDELATLFWPDRTQEAARSNLRKLLQEARSLDLPQLECDRNSVRWNVSTDVAEYKAALKRGDTDAAVALYRGPALRGLDGGESDAFSTWLAGERGRLHTAWREAVVAVLPHRGPAGALALAHLLLDDDPFDEDAMVAALDAHRELGDSRGADEAFRSYAERLIEELGVEPSARVRSAAARTTRPLAQEAEPAPPNASPAPPATAPAPTASSFIGRARELKELRTLLTNPACRLLTVTGPGGMGKSTLVKQAVRELASSYADGVTWIALDDLTDVAQVAPRIAAELALDLVPTQDPLERIAEHIGSRQMLLVLDNSEHLSRLSELVERLIDAAPRLQVLSTSRTRIGARGEGLVPLLGLTLPPLDGPASDIVAADAVQLFIAHARASDPRFNVATNLTPITRLVHAVGGLPLAILLAASWVRLLPITELVSEVTQSLDVLAHVEEGDERPEHRSVRATFEQSWRLLAPQEQRALAALAVMVGAFTLAAARDVAEAPLPLLASLVDKSLVQADGAGRFSLHPLIQQFAAEKLASDVAAEASARGAHCRHFDQWLRRVADVPRGEELRAMREIEQALENLRAMWHHAIATQAWDTLAANAVPLMRSFELRNRVPEGAALLDAADAALADVSTEDHAPDRARANVWRAQGTLDYRSGANERCMQRAERSLPLCRTLGIRKGIKGNLNCLGLAAWQLNRRDDAARYFAEAVAEARADGDVEGEAMFLANAALVEKAKGNFANALVLTEQALAVHRVRNNQVSIRMALNNLGNLLRALQRPRDAVVVLNEALATIGESDLDPTRAFVLCNLALAHDDLEEFDHALSYAERALGLLGSHGDPGLEASIRHALARGCTGLGRFDEAERHLARAVQLALAQHRTSVAVGTLMHWGCWHAARGDAVRAAALLRFAATHATVDGPDRDVAERSLAALSKSLGPGALARAESEGEPMTVEQLAAELVAASSRAGRSP
jgi:predicted ATPase/DNA-binding SARP family transcriptional activator